MQLTKLLCSALWLLEVATVWRCREVCAKFWSKASVFPCLRPCSRVIWVIWSEGQSSAVCKPAASYFLSLLSHGRLCNKCSSQHLNYINFVVRWRLSSTFNHDIWPVILQMATYSGKHLPFFAQPVAVLNSKYIFNPGEPCGWLNRRQLSIFNF